LVGNLAMAGPVGGIKVVEQTVWVAGPAACRMLQLGGYEPHSRAG
jgi:crotonobetainyl-CoA:carnitine CoA-transferase CaiB-like acyl-CoA transferase